MPSPVPSNVLLRTDDMDDFARVFHETFLRALRDDKSLAKKIYDFIIEIHPDLHN